SQSRCSRCSRCTSAARSTGISRRASARSPCTRRRRPPPPTRRPWPADRSPVWPGERMNEPPAQPPELARTIEALLFLSSDPLSTAELADATEAGEEAVGAALALLSERHSPGRSGI